MTLNRILFPRLAQYLDGLPQQLDSYPSALTRADFSIILRRNLAPHLVAVDLPASLSVILSSPWTQGDWIPTAHYVALCELARDHVWQTDAAYHQGMFEVATEMYSGPAYKMLFFMFGPSVVAMSAAKRWDTLHKGTTLAIKKQKKESLDLLLSYPQNLFSEAGVQSLGAAFCSIAQGSRGKNPKFTPVSFSHTEAEVIISWEY
jgi:hypothetical protein